MSVDEYVVSPGYGRPLGELLAAGGYDHANEYLTEERFPVADDRGGASAVEVALVCLEHRATTDEVGRAVEAAGLRAGGIAELLALGAEQPELQRSFPIVALGAASDYPHDYRRIPFLWGTPRVRHLDLRWDEHGWGGNIRFLCRTQRS